MKRHIAAAALVAASFQPFVQAQEYPSRTVSIVVPFAAGGPTDTVARLVGQSMSTTLKQSVVIDNVAGAGGTLAASKVARSAPDGYTLFLHHIGHATSYALYRKLPYHPVNDFQTIGLVNTVPMTLVTRNDFPANNLKEFLTYVKANKDKMNLGNAGIGAASHLCGMLFMSTIQTDLQTISYKGTNPAMNDLLGGQIDFMCDQTTNTTQYIRSGRIKAMGVTTLKRLPSLKEVPTLHEAGLTNFEVSVWHGLYAPKNTPKPVVDKLVAALNAALKDPNVVSKLADLGSEPVPASLAQPDAHRQFLQKEIDRWTPIIQKAGVYAD